MTPIEQFLKKKNISAWKVEKLANLSKGLIGKAIKTNAVLSLETIEKISIAFPDANKTFLHSGIGDILIKPTQSNQKELTGLLNIIVYVFKDIIKPDQKRERLKKIINELSKIYQYEEIYKRLGFEGKEGSKVLVGIKSPDLFITALVEKFNINREYIEKGTEPMFADKSNTIVLRERLVEKDEIIKALKETISTQKELISSLKIGNKIGNNK